VDQEDDPQPKAQQQGGHIACRKPVGHTLPFLK
jgi:hypothetical protein